MTELIFENKYIHKRKVNSEKIITIKIDSPLETICCISIDSEESRNALGKFEKSTLLDYYLSIALREAVKEYNLPLPKIEKSQFIAVNLSKEYQQKYEFIVEKIRQKTREQYSEVYSILEREYLLGDVWYQNNKEQFSQYNREMQFIAKLIVKKIAEEDNWKKVQKIDMSHARKSLKEELESTGIREILDKYT